MPRLTGENVVIRRRPPLLAYVKKLPKPSLRNILLFLVAIFILRNLLRNHYRNEEMKYIRGDSEQWAKEVESAIPMTEEERREYWKSRGDDVNKLKHDISYLLNEVHTLRKNAKGPIGSVSQHDSDLNAMDLLHIQKRKAHEEKLLKDHPNYLRNDYGNEEMKYMRGGSEEWAKEVENAIPMAEEERREYWKSRGDEVNKLKHDISYLLNEVHTLRKNAKGPIGSVSERDSDLKSMDLLHIQKRKAHEEQLLKGHPNFVPSKRVNKWARNQPKAGGADVTPAGDGVTATT